MGLVFTGKTRAPVGCASIIQFTWLHRLLWDTAHRRWLLNERQAIRPLAAWLLRRVGHSDLAMDLPAPARSYRKSVCAPPLPRKPARAPAKISPSSALVAWVVLKHRNTCPFRVLRRMPGRSYPTPTGAAIEGCSALIPGRWRRNPKPTLNHACRNPLRNEWNAGAHFGTKPVVGTPRCPR